MTSQNTNQTYTLYTEDREEPVEMASFQVQNNGLIEVVEFWSNGLEISKELSKEEAREVWREMKKDGYELAPQ